MLKPCLLFLFLFYEFSHGCRREPSVYHSRLAKIPGNNGYRIKLQDEMQTYVPEEVYTVYVLGSRTFNKVQHFQRFTLNIESVDDSGNISPQKVGSFQLFGDNLSKFNEDCVNTISETNNLPKTEISFLWRAPPAGSGCITFRAMVLEDSTHWYADDGELSKTICEQTEKDRKFSLDDCCACDEAKYNLIFEGLWSNRTHPRDFPFSLWLTHFSDVIGASHEPGFTFWGEGQISSDGFRSLAEWGSIRLMESELKAKSKHLRTIIKAAGLWYPKVNTNTSTNFRVDRKHNLVSMASMLGPSPDWVVGVDGLNLCLPNCSWIENLIVDLYPWDAGTDNGISYMSPNSETVPREKIYKITTKYPEDPRAPFYDPIKNEMNPLARFYFTREKLIPKSCDESFLTAQLDISENTEDTSRPECAVTEYTEWSPCSVTCGKGLSMRTREYVIPQKAQMFQCNRQLISKEMCVADVPECEGGQEEPDSEEKLENNEGICKTSEWSPWSECSSTCGVGLISRTRHFIDRMGRKKCPHVDIIEREKCMGPPCIGEEDIPDPMCPATDWSDWSPCSASCGKGVKLRTRLLLVDPGLQQKCSSRIELVQQRPCMDTPDCTFDMATAKDVCMQESIEGPCTGHFNRWYFEPRKLMCVPFVYGGCRGNRNNFLTSEECTEACKVVRDSLIGSGGSVNPGGAATPGSPSTVFDMATAKEVCMQESAEGTCTGNFNRWYFEPRKSMCVPFLYSGCGGNRNNFLTSTECNEACKVVIDSLIGNNGNVNAGTPSKIFDMATAKEVCMQESAEGPCAGSFNRWYFEPRKFMCVPFIFGGCGGNRNNFLTSEECTEACKVVRDSLIGNIPGNFNPSIPLQSSPSAVLASGSGLNGPAVDCMVTDWSDWTPCSATCGTGYNERFRMIKRPAENGGKPCPKRLQKRRKCNLIPCF